ncbi:alpha/beta hydrolase family protein [Thalassotalea euphylliae]|uniref:alpha/beta hydrolase family protein n=1 Tax=Thalassotalea euphylliae TaxID=1655234 RepID=UPI0036352455
MAIQLKTIWEETNLKKVVLTVLATISILALIWYIIWGLKPYDVDRQLIETRYSYNSVQPEMEITQESPTHFAFSYTTFDGTEVNGRLEYPHPLAKDMAKVPVFIGAHGMGRSDNRWFMDSFKERPTIEQTDKITEQALQAGYAVIAIDARNHGKRKDLNYTIRDVMTNMHFWGKRDPYEVMIVDTVKDHRVLLDWLLSQPQFDHSNIAVGGYSMGGHVSLLLAAVDSRISRVLSIVPPYLDDKVAIVAPKNFVEYVHVDKLWLVTANDDEHASEKENAKLFSAIAAADKKHVQFEGGHILPEGYYETFTGWYE